MEPYDSLAYTTSDPIRGVLEYFRGGHLSKPETWRNLVGSVEVFPCLSPTQFSMGNQKSPDRSCFCFGSNANVTEL